MKKHHHIVWAVLAILMLGRAGILSAQTNDTEKQLSENFAKIQSGTAKTTTHQDFMLPTGERIIGDSTSTSQWQRKGDVVLYRSEMDANQRQEGGAVAALPSKGHFLTVHDGEFHYVYSEEMGEKKVEKYKPAPAQYGDPHALLDGLRTHFNAKPLPDEKVDGFDCAVFELTPKEPANSPTSRSKSYFRKDIGLNIKNIGYDKDGKEAFVSITTDIEVNVPIPPDRFVFHAPPDVKIEDKTKE